MAFLRLLGNWCTQSPISIVISWHCCFFYLYNIFSLWNGSPIYMEMIGYKSFLNNWHYITHIKPIKKNYCFSQHEILKYFLVLLVSIGMKAIHFVTDLCSWYLISTKLKRVWTLSKGYSNKHFRKIDFGLVKEV